MIDQAIVIGYLVITLIVGIYVGRNTKTIHDFAVGSRNFSTIVLVSTVFASVVDAGMTTGLASSTFSVGPIFLLAFLGIIISSFSISFFIAPKMKPFFGLISSGDIFEKLYGKKAKTLMGFSTIIESTLTTAIQIFAISQITQYFFGLKDIVSSIIVSMIIIIYTFRGGIRSVTATDVFQFGIMIIAIPIMCAMSLISVGGINNVLDLLKEKTFYFSQDQSSNNLEYAAIFLSFCLPSLYPLCIQRMLMAKNTQQIKTTFFINGILSLPFYLSVGLIGIVAYILIPNTDANIVFPALINEVLPIGIKGFVIAGLIAIFMSTVDSILNIGSLAIIHDVVGTLKKKELDPTTELKLMKLASLAIAVIAVFICHFFSSVMDIVFFLMVIGNAIFFPGFLWGILGFQASKFGFWFGVVTGALTVVTCSFILNIFPLYTMLIAISLNSSVILLSCCFKNHNYNLKIFNKINLNSNLLKLNEFKNTFFNEMVAEKNYCTTFFICSIMISIFPFFFPAINGIQYFGKSILILNAFIAFISLAMIFRELWKNRIKKIFNIVWILIITLALPTQSLYQLFKSDFSLIWFADCLLILPLIFLLTTKKGTITSCFLGFLSAIFINHLGNNLIEQNVSLSFGYWTFFTHISVFLICLSFFRKTDKEEFISTTLKLAHEAGRTMSAVYINANILQNQLPILINQYRKSNHENLIKEEDLKYLIEMPKSLAMSSSKSWQNINNFVDNIKQNKKNQNLSFHSINESLESAINNSPQTKIIKQRIILKNDDDFLFYGDNAQIVHVILNLLENAWHAIQDNPKSNILIWTEQSSLIIKDTGIGIDQKDLPNIFDDFFSTKGTNGQGLSFCKMVMEQHNGEIICESKKGFFTQFKLTFPEVPIHKD